MRSTPPAFSLIALTILSLAACHSAPPPAEKVRTVLVQSAESAAQNGASILTGDVRARHEVDLAFRVGGKITTRLVDIGASIKPGTPLAHLDPSDLQLARQSAGAQLAAAESDAATAKAEQARYADLLAKKFVSPALAEAKDNTARAASARLEQARAQAGLSGNQVAYGTLSSTFSGVITAVLADAGQVVAAGQPVLRLARPEEKEIAVVVPENRLAQLRAAKGLQVGFWALPGTVVAGQLRELAPAADPLTRTYAARIRLLNPPSTVHLGMTAQVAMGDTAPDATLRVPLTAVIHQGNGAVVWEVVNGKATPRPVEVRRFTETHAELSNGLQAGAQVVVVGAQQLVADQAVRPQSLQRESSVR